MNQCFLRICKRLLFRCSAAYAELTLIRRSAVGAGPAACACLLRITLLWHLSGITLLRIALLRHLSGVTLLRITLLWHLSGVTLLRITLLWHLSGITLLRIALLRHLSGITLLRVTLLGHLSGIALLRITLLGHLSGVALLRITLLRHSGSCHTTGGRHAGHAAYGSHTRIRTHAHAGSRHGARVTQIHQRSADVFRNRHILLIIRRIYSAGIVRVHAALNSVDNSA